MLKIVQSTINGKLNYIPLNPVKLFTIPSKNRTAIFFHHMKITNETISLFKKMYSSHLKCCLLRNIVEK